MTHCHRDFQTSVHEFGKGVKWATAMFDSWGNFPDVTLTSHTNSIGDFEECENILSPTSGTTTLGFKGKYCSSHLSIDSANVTLESIVGVCYPSTCSVTEIQILNGHLYRKIFNNGIEARFLSFGVNCYEEEQPLGFYDYIYIYMVFILLTIIACLATIVEMFYQYFQISRPVEDVSLRILLSFSFISNGQQLLSTTMRKDDVSCIHGIRFLTMVWIVIHHTWEIPNMTDLVHWKNQQVTQTMYEQWLMHGITNATIAVDTFLFISGLLVTYGTMRQIQKTRKFINVIQFYIHRYIRLTPVYLITIGTTSVILPRLNNGPNWYIFQHEASYCKQNWWKNALYLNNYAIINGRLGTECMKHCWYLAVDMQLYMLSPILIYVLWKRPSIGLVLLLILTIISAICTGVITYVNGYLPTNLPPNIMEYSYYNNLYVKPHTRAGPYLVGIGMGYILHKYQERKLLLKKIYVTAGWICSATMCLFIIYCCHPYYVDGVKPSTIVSVSYSSLHRTLWVVGIGWIVFACSHDYGGPISTFLSWKVFIPLGRLSYSCYLLSCVIQLTFFWSQKTLLHYNVFMMVILFLGQLVFSLLVALCFSMSFEFPFLALEKALKSAYGNINRHKSHDI